MKKILLPFVIFSSVLGLAQQVEPTEDVLNSFSVFDLMRRSNDDRATCGSDTVLYVSAKATANSGLSINNATSAHAYCQYFDTPQAITVEGFQFVSRKANATGGTSINVTCELFLAGADSMPTGSALASAVVPVDTNFYGGNFVQLTKTATFGTAITMTQPYLIMVTNNSANAILMYSSSYLANDGDQEWLGSGKIGATWIRSYDLVIGTDPYDADMFMHPIVNYELTSGFDVTPNCGTPGTVSVTSTSSPILSNKMYSSAVYYGAEADQYNWDWADGSPVENGINPSHAYATAGPFTIVAVDTLFGWTQTCTETSNKSTCNQPANLDENMVSLDVYPNPSSGQVIIASSEGLNSLQIFDLSGKIVLSNTLNGINQTEINVSHLPAGLYAMKVQLENGTFVNRRIEVIN
jgi:hypothetical protein